MAQNAPKKTLHRRHDRPLKAECHPLLRSGMSTLWRRTESVELPLSKKDVAGTPRTSMNCATTASVVAHNGRVNDLVQAKKRVQLWELGCPLHVCTRERDLHNSIDHLVSVLQLENFYGFLNRTMGICLCNTTEMSTNTTSLHDHSDVHYRL